MKVFLRILVILLALAMTIYAFWPPVGENETASKEESPSPQATSSTAGNSKSHQLIKNLLGGSALDSGNKAQEKISEVNEARNKDFEESGL